MADGVGLVVIVPSRGRPEAAVELARTFRRTCALDTRPVFAVDSDDPTADEYVEVVRLGLGSVIKSDNVSMVDALNKRAVGYANIQDGPRPMAIAFMGDDHRPRTPGWDVDYLEALRKRPGLVYGNDLLQGENLPTQVAMSAEVIRALGHMAPPVLTHMYVDNYWLQLGRDADCITYLPHVVVEHMHPYAEKAPVDEGYLRVNSREMFARDEAASAAYWAEFGARDVAAVRAALPVKSRP